MGYDTRYGRGRRLSTPREEPPRARTPRERAYDEFNRLEKVFTHERVGGSDDRDPQRVLDHLDRLDRLGQERQEARQKVIQLSDAGDYAPRDIYEGWKPRLHAVRNMWIDRLAEYKSRGRWSHATGTQHLVGT